jgi:HEAT repeat protein
LNVADPDLRTRYLYSDFRAAVRKYGDPDIFEQISHSIDHPDPGTRSSVCEMLGYSRNHKYTALICQRLSEPLFYVTASALDALLELNDPSAISALEEALDKVKANDFSINRNSLISYFENTPKRVRLQNG